MSDGTPDPSDAPTGRVDALVSGVRFGRFASVGIVGTAVDVTVLLVLSEGFGVLPVLATVAGIELAILVMFAINEHWTYANEGEAGVRPTLRRLVRSHAVRAAGSTTQVLVFVLVFRYYHTPLVLSGIDLWLLVAKAIGIAIGVGINYTFETLLTWQVHLEE